MSSPRQYKTKQKELILDCIRLHQGSFITIKDVTEASEPDMRKLAPRRFTATLIASKKKALLHVASSKASMEFVIAICKIRPRMSISF